MKASQFLTAG